MEAELNSPHGPIYWFVFHSTRKIRDHFQRNRRKFLLVLLLIVVALIFSRASFQFLFVELRKHLLLVVGAMLFVTALRWSWNRTGRMAKVGVLAGGAAITALVIWGGAIYNHFWFYHRYSYLRPEELSELMVSDHERIQPLSSVYALAHDAVTENDTPMNPDFVRVGDEFHWTIAIEPTYPISRIFGGVNEVFDIPGSAASPNFAPEHRRKVQFQAGEHLMFSRNAHTATIRTFGPWKYFNYEPAEVLYFTDEKGEWIEVVSLIRWVGLIFPWPEFGGVQIIRQEEHTFAGYLKMLFLGMGTWIPPEDIAKYPYLVGQNLLSKKVSEPIADSFRFQNGFLAPLPGYHDGDIRIPELEREVNPQPFIGYFRRRSEKQGALYHYFALEPYDVDKQGLSVSIFVPADGSSKVYTFHHLKHGESYSGVSSIATKVMESRKDYDWNRNRPVEHRPFIREIDGKIRFFWLTTVVAPRLGNEKGKFIAGSVPEVVLTDGETNVPVWVNPREPESWIEQTRAEIGSLWH